MARRRILRSTEKRGAKKVWAAVIGEQRKDYLGTRGVVASTRSGDGLE